MSGIKIEEAKVKTAKITTKETVLIKAFSTVVQKFASLDASKVIGAEIWSETLWIEMPEADKTFFRNMASSAYGVVSNLIKKGFIVKKINDDKTSTLALTQYAYDLVLAHVPQA